MSCTYISAELRRLIISRANGRCEYCLVPQNAVYSPPQPDHIIAEQHGGQTEADNLALSCLHCNRHKGPNVASVDVETNQLIFLFNPRTQLWAEHFVLEDATIRGVTAVGRITVRVLDLNAPERVEIRQTLIEGGLYP